MSDRLHQISISPPLNAAEQEMLRRQDSWTVADDGASLSYEGFVDTVEDAVEWLELFIGRLRPGSETDLLIEKGFTFDHELNGILWLRGHDADGALIVKANKIEVLKLSEPLQGFDWPALLRSRAWLAEQTDEQAKPLIGLVDSLVEFLRESGAPAELLDPSDFSGQ